MIELLSWIRNQFAAAPWGDWRDFWLQHVLDDRFVVIYFLPFLAILFLVPRSRTRQAVVVATSAWVALIFGPPYALTWLAACCGFYFLGEKLALGSRRTDARPPGPAIITGAVVVAAWIAVLLLRRLDLPAEWNRWLLTHAPWLFPFGSRGYPWEPWWHDADRPVADAVPDIQFLNATLLNPHNIGVAYLMVRLLHYYAEIRRDGIPADRRSLLNFLAWVCYAPTLMQGPIERYALFHDQLAAAHEHRRWSNLAPAALRILWGVAKAVIVARLFLPYMTENLGFLTPAEVYYRAPHSIHSYTLLYFGVYLQIYALYLEFSGYCDVSAGMSRLLGLRQIENFNNPWFATSLRDFWRRWHISLSSILRDYIYIPLGGNRRHVSFNLCLTFAICGLWHVPLVQMAAWGVVMGLLLSINQHWAAWCKSLDDHPASTPAAIRRFAQKLRPIPSILAWALTIHCFVMSLLIFFGGRGGLRVAWELIRRPFNAVAGSEFLSPWL